MPCRVLVTAVQFKTGIVMRLLHNNKSLEKSAISSLTAIHLVVRLVCGVPIRSARRDGTVDRSKLVSNFKKNMNIFMSKDTSGIIPHILCECQVNKSNTIY